jgi:hypothetical protein
MPLDLIPGFILGLGLIDDGALLAGSGPPSKTVSTTSSNGRKTTREPANTDLKGKIRATPRNSATWKQVSRNWGSATNVECSRRLRFRLSAMF